MTEKHFVVIGNGPAGNQAAFTLRENDPKARITIISRGRGTCYLPKRLPDYLAGIIQEEQLYISRFETYKEKNIKLRCCQSVAALDVRNRELILEHKEIIPFDGLIIAVGGAPRIPERLSAFKDLMFTLKTLEDANIWINKLSQIDSILMIGGDLASLAVAKALIHLKKKIYFMLNEDAFWPLRGRDDLFGLISERLSQQGIEVLVCEHLRSLAQLSDGQYEVAMNGIVLNVGMVGAFYGYAPDIQFLASSGLRIDRGILVDEFLNTGFPDIYATGDCAQIYHPEISDYWISVGHENAELLGRVAAANLAGGAKSIVKPESIFSIEGIKINTSWWSEF